MIAIEQEVTRDRGVNVGEVGQHKDFSVLENVTAISKSCQTLGCETVAIIMSGCVDTQLIDAVANGLLCLVVTFDEYMRNTPVIRPRLYIPGMQLVISTLTQPFSILLNRVLSWFSCVP